jgi:hypothetical protein
MDEKMEIGKVREFSVVFGLRQVAEALSALSAGTGAHPTFRVPDDLGANRK